MPPAPQQAMQAAQRAPAQRQATQPAAPVNKPFDINIYFQAVGLFFNDFFGKKLPYFFNNMGPVLNKAGTWWNKLPQDEQISYAVMIFGDLMLVAGIALFFLV